MRYVGAPKRLPRYPLNERSTKTKPRRAKKRQFFSFVLFAVVLVGTCLFLSRVVLSSVIEPKFLQSDAEARIREAETKTGINGNIISVTGVWRVMEASAQGRLLARRAAITDARRKLLIQRQALLGDPRFQTNRGTANVSGFLAGTHIIKNEGVMNGVYFVELEMHIDELLHSGFNEERFASALDDL